jgi:outer membrane efflux protein
MIILEKIYISLLLVLLSSSSLSAQGTISYQEYLTKIKAQLPQIQKSQLTVKLAKNTIEQALAVEDPVLEFSTSVLQEYQYTTNTDPTYLQGVGIGAALTKKNIDNGTTLGYGSSIFVGDYKIPQLYVNYSYPIFYNAGGIQDKFKIYAARNNLDIEQWKQQDTDARTLNEFKKLYFQWVKTNAVISLLENNIKNAEKLQQNTKAKQVSGLADLDDVEKSSALVIKYQTQLVQYHTYADELLAMFEPYINTNELVPDNSEVARHLAVIKEQELITVNIKEHFSFKVYKLQEQYFDEYKKVLENTLLPKTDLNLQVALKGRDEDFNQAVSNMKELDYTAAIVFSVPLDKAKAKADLAALEISSEFLDQDIRQNTNSLQAQKDKLLANIYGQQKQLELSFKNLKSLQKRYRIEKSKYEKARLNLSYLIETQNAIIAEKINSKNLELGIIFNYFDLLIVGGRK